MNDKEKMIDLIEHASDNVTFDEIINQYLSKYFEDITIIDIDNIHKIVSKYLTAKIRYYDNAIDNAREKALYLEKYLTGKMYSDRESSERHVDVQANNARSIIYFCDKIKKRG